MKLKNLFYVFSAVGFFFPYILKFMLMSQNADIKIFAIYSLGKFNLIYFAVVIIFFFMGLKDKFSFLRTGQIVFVSVYLGYIFISYFVLAKIKVEHYVKSHNLNAKIVKMSELQKYPNFKIYYKEADYAAIKILPKVKTSLPFNYKKDRAQ